MIIPFLKGPPSADPTRKPKRDDKLPTFAIDAQDNFVRDHEEHHDDINDD
jgi:hypothetical protein